MRTFSRFSSATLLATLFHLACTPFEVAKDAGADAAPDKGKGSADTSTDTPIAQTPSADASSQEAGADARVDEVGVLDAASAVDAGSDLVADTRQDALSEAPEANHVDSVADTSETQPLGPPTKNLALWLTADRGVTLTDGLISRWADQSGHGLDAVQTDPKYRPALLPGALNGMPVVRSTGLQLLRMGPAFSDLTNGISILVVSRPLTPSATETSVLKLFRFLHLGHPDSPESTIILQLGVARNASSPLLEFDQGSGTSGAVTVAFDQWQIFQGSGLGGAPGDDSICEASIAGQVGASEFCSAPPVTFRDDNVIGSSVNLAADVAELLVYDYADSDQADAAAAYLRRKWGL